MKTHFKNLHLLKVQQSMPYMAATRFLYLTDAIYRTNYHNPTKTVYLRFSAN